MQTSSWSILMCVRHSAGSLLHRVQLPFTASRCHIVARVVVVFTTGGATSARTFISFGHWTCARPDELRAVATAMTVANAAAGRFSVAAAGRFLI